MCARYATQKPPELLRQAFRTSNVLINMPARYNIAPTQEVAVVRYNPESHERSLDLVRWGLIPHWAKDPSIGTRLINARAESLMEKTSFRDAFRRRRCLIPADAFYEWKQGSKPKQPYAIRRRDGGLLVFAGLWENWRDPEGRWLRSCTIITTAANRLVAPLHDRMPAIIHTPDYALWLGEEPAEAERLLALLRPFPPHLLEAYPVSREVNNVRSEGAALLDPMGPSVEDAAASD